MKRHHLLFLPLLFFAATVQAQVPGFGQPMRLPAFAGGVPGVAQFQAMVEQRHQARTLLYREALEELQRNPAAADLPECPPGPLPQAGLCLARAGQPAAAEPSPTIPSVQRRLALLVGNNDYKAPIPGLETPVADVEQIASLLHARFGYETKVLTDASKAEIIEAFNTIAAQAGEDDSVLLLYAGHGYLMDDTGMGFWIPVDASVKSAGNWISNTDITRLLKAIRSRQIILVSDSCFSGSLTREQKLGQRAALKVEEVLRRRSVLAFSSGGDEPVSDEGKEGHSIFAWNLIRTLDQLRGVTAGYEVWRTVHGEVMRDYAQEPQYGAVVSAGHVEGGEYLFETR